MLFIMRHVRVGLGAVLMFFATYISVMIRRLNNEKIYFEKEFKPSICVCQLLLLKDRVFCANAKIFFLAIVGK